MSLHAQLQRRAAEKRPIPVKVRAVEKTPGSGPARYSGALEPMARVDMAFRVNSYSDYGVANALGFISYLIAGLVAWIYVRHNVAGQVAG